jgi:hypothetical protein
MAYENRIVGTGTEHPEQLLANPNNWRIHPKAQQDALESSLTDVGWVQHIIVNQRTGHVVDGHMRASVAISRNEQEVPVVYVDLTDEEERQILATYDPIAAMAVTDTKAINELINDMHLTEELVNAIHQSMPEWNPDWDDTEQKSQALTSTDYFSLTLEVPFEQFDSVKKEVENFISQWSEVRIK